MEETNKMALASMIAGILSIVLSCCCGLGMIAGGLAVIFAGLSRVDEPCLLYTSDAADEL